MRKGKALQIPKCADRVTSTSWYFPDVFRIARVGGKDGTQMRFGEI